MTDRDRIFNHLIRLLYVVRNAACHRTLSQYKGDFAQNYWILIFNNFLDIAILEWCKIFGSDKEETHWKRLVDNEDEFLEQLLRTLGIDSFSWETYQRNVKKYRDRIVAHHQEDPKITHYPNLEFILESSFFYHNWLVSKLRNSNVTYEPADLRDYYADFFAQASKFAEVSYQSTKGIREKVF